MRPFAPLLMLTVVVVLAGCASTTAPKAQAREFWLFNSALDFNETAVGIPHDIFAPSQIVVDKGDTVTIHYFNTEETEAHTFTMDAPYASDHRVPAGGEVNVTFVANTVGVFAYRCTEHQPTMTGWLVVLGQ